MSTYKKFMLNYIQYHDANDIIINNQASILSVSFCILIVFMYDNKNLEILIYMTNICIYIYIYVLIV